MNQKTNLEKDQGLRKVSYKKKKLHAIEETQNGTPRKENLEEGKRNPKLQHSSSLKYHMH